MVGFYCGKGQENFPKGENLSYVHSVEHELGLILCLIGIREENTFTLKWFCQPSVVTLTKMLLI